MTHPDRNALAALIEAVEGGTLQDNPYFGMPMITACYPKDDRGFLVSDKWNDRNVMDAYHGSLDAAKALHEALLPGWGWAVEDAEACVWHPDTSGISRDMMRCTDNPARAWLLAILRAIVAEGGE